MNSKNLFSNSIFYGGLVFFVSGLLANFFNYLYRILMARALGPEDFGELIAIISFLLILAVPASPVQVAAARFSAVFEAQEAKMKLKNLFFYLTKIFGLIGFILAILAFIFVSQIQDFLNFSSKNYIYIAIGTVIVMLFSGVTKGILQGLKKFLPLSKNILFESMARPAFAIILVTLGFKVSGALLGFLFSLIFGYFFSLYFLKNVLGIKQESEELFIGKEEKEIWKYVFLTFLAFLFINILLNVDKVLVKHYFSPLETGIFSAASTLGQIIFLGISLIAGVLFPVIISERIKNENYFNSLKISIFFSFLIGLIGFVVFFLFSDKLIILLFGEKYISGAIFLCSYSVSMTLMGLVFLLSYFFMALNEFSFLYVLVLACFSELFFIYYWHNNISQVIFSFSLALLLALFGLTGLLFLKRKMLYENFNH